VLHRPSLSLEERDRRWGRVRALLGARGLQGLIVGTFRSREAYDSYLTNDHLDGTVIFPLDGAPTAITWNSTHLSRANESAARGEVDWVADRRPAFGGAATAEIVREKGLAQARLGIVGLSATSAGEREGTLPHSFWQNLIAALPQAGFEDVTEAYADLVLVKSAEEAALVRYAAAVSEAACRRMLDACVPGVAEDEVYAATMAEIFRHGCDVRYPMMSLHSGPANIAWGRPRWIVRAEPPRVLAAGDMVQAEIHTCYGGQEAQVQMAVGIGDIGDVNRRCAAIARDSYEAGLAIIRPGLRFEALIRAMAAPIEAAGCWAKTPLAHTMNYGAVGGTQANRAQIAETPEGRIEAAVPARMRRPDMALVPGMLLELEPNACLGSHRVNIGGPVLVTETGCEELSDLPTRMRLRAA